MKKSIALLFIFSLAVSSSFAHDQKNCQPTSKSVAGNQNCHKEINRGCTGYMPNWYGLYPTAGQLYVLPYVPPYVYHYELIPFNVVNASGISSYGAYQHVQFNL